MNGAGGGGRVAVVGIGEEGIREANVGIVRRISGMRGNYSVGDGLMTVMVKTKKKIQWVMDENIEGKQW